MSLPNLYNIEQQLDAIALLELMPEVITPYIHYPGEESTLLPYNLTVPIIPRNNSLACLIISHIGREHYHNISITPLGQSGKIGVPYLLQDRDGNTLIMKLSALDDYRADFDLKPSSAIDDNSKLCLSRVNLRDMQFIKSDEFTNETLIAYILNAKIKDTDPQFYVKHYSANICTDNQDINRGLISKAKLDPNLTYGANIMEYCDLGMVSYIARTPFFSQYLSSYHVNHLGVDSIKKLFHVDLIKCILTQVTLGLHVMQKRCGFTSGDLKCGNVFIKSEPVDVTYMGIRIEAPFSCKIADYGKSSAQIQRADGKVVRCYNDSTLANIYLALHPFKNEFYVSRGELYYTPDLSPTQMYTRTRHMGIPYYQSFDYYTFLVSFLTIAEVYYTFFSSSELMDIFWYPVFTQSSNVMVRENIYRHVLNGTGARYPDTIAMLKSTPLKCDAMELVIAALQ